jgi:hypothetical protein
LLAEVYVYRLEKLMQIVCATPHAAAQVLTILYAAHFQPIRDFTIQPVLSIMPPLIFTMVVARNVSRPFGQIRVPNSGAFAAPTPPDASRPGSPTAFPASRGRCGG